MKLLIVGLGLVVAACSTTKNPAKCVDGVCVDPGRPYCDFDGLIDGKPETCIAVECTAGELEACRGDTAVKCNETATDFVEIQCPLGCDPVSKGCRECSSNAQCSTDTPICDPESSVCRTCSFDDECDSKVCNAGRCVAETEIVYAAPSGSGSCARNQPCSLASAIFNARSGGKILRMLPGMYTAQLDVTGTNNVPLQIVATGATISTIGDVPAIQVANGAIVKARNLNSISERHLRCTSSNAIPSALELDGGMLTGVGGSTGAEVERCTAKLSRMQIMSASGTAMYVLPDGALELDRVFMSTGVTQSITVVNATRARVQITNSLLVDTHVSQFGSQDTQLPGTSFTLAYSTLIAHGVPWARLCEDAATFRTVRIENSIIAGLGNVAEAFQTNASDCSYVNTIIHPHVGAAPAGVIALDPQFVDGASGNFHLKQSSPALDRGGGGIVAPTNDLEGRPRGAMPDLGAYERP